jgi:hypothetical protein
MEKRIKSLLGKKSLSSKDESFIESQMEQIIKKYCDGCESIDPRKSRNVVQGRRKWRKNGF